MNESAKTKKALRGSLFALFLCIVLLIGTTFAWFTDSVSTGVNKIQAGNLKVDIVKASDGKTSLKGDKMSFENKDGSPDILWEPGVRFKTPAFKIKNDGNLALKYKMSLNGITGDKELLDVITFSVVDKDGKAVDLDTFEGHLDSAALSDELYIQGHMDEAAGNEYQGKALEGMAITVTATQDTVESDSFGDQYDKDATYPLTFKASDTTSLNEALDSVTTEENKNVDIKLTGTGNTLTGVNGINPKAGNNLSVDFNNNVIEIGGSVGSSATETNGAQFLKGSNVTLKDGTYKFSDKNQYKKILIQNYANLNLENVTLDASNVRYALSSNCGKVTIKGNSNIRVKSGGTALDVMHWENASYKKDGTHVVFEESMTGTVDGKIDVYCYRGSSVIKPVDDGGATLVIKGGTFKNSGLSLAEFKAYVPSGYKVTTNSDGSYTVSK